MIRLLPQEQVIPHIGGFDKIKQPKEFRNSLTNEEFPRKDTDQIKFIAFILFSCIVFLSTPNIASQCHGNKQKVWGWQSSFLDDNGLPTQKKNISQDLPVTLCVSHQIQSISVLLTSRIISDKQLTHHDTSLVTLFFSNHLS